MQEVNTCVNLEAGLPLPVVIDVPKACFVEAITTPPAAVGNVWPHLKEVIPTGVTPTIESKYANTRVIFAAKETDFRIKVLANMRHATGKRPRLGIAGSRQSHRHVVATEPRRVRLRHETREECIVTKA